jgi:hypothetical protein
VLKRLVGAALIVLGLGLVAPVASAQVPQYPPVPLTVCVKLIAGTNNGIPFLLLHQSIILFGPPDCGAFVGEEITLEIHSKPVIIGTTRVAEDGSFRIEGALPDGVTPGDHQLVVNMGSKQIVRPVQVVSALGKPASSQTSAKSVHNIALLALWTVLLLAGTAAIVFYGRRRFAMAGGGRRRSGRVAPETSVQHIDTTRFTPMRQLPDEPPAEPRKSTE